MDIRIAQGACLGRRVRPKKTEEKSASSLDLLGWGDSDDYSTDVSDNPRKRGRRVERAVAAPHGALLDL